jgi:signal transduction histidine kinase
LSEANAALVAKQRVADTLSEAATLLAAGPGPGPMLTRILELLGRVVAYRGAAILLEDGPDILMVGAAGNAQKYLGQRFATDGPDPRARVYRERRVVVLDGDAVSDDGVSAPPSEGAGGNATCRWIGLPLSADGNTFGVLALESDAPCTYDPSELSLLEAFAGQAAAAVWIAQLYAQGQTNAATAERERLARDLHDAVTQTLFSASIFTEMLPAQFAQEPEEVPKTLAKVGQLIRSALAEMRTLLMELRPTALIAVELHELVKNLVQAARARTHINLTYLVEGEPCGPLPPETQMAVYRIAQELLNNVAKHSAASDCEIMFSYLEDGVELTVSDNGRGFDPQTVSPDHMGLAIMQERARAIGGQLLFESKPGAGTRATLWWPHKKEAS